MSLNFLNDFIEFDKDENSVQWYDPLYTKNKALKNERVNVLVKDLLNISIDDLTDKVDVRSSCDWNEDELSNYINTIERIRRYLKYCYFVYHHPFVNGKDLTNIIRSLKSFCKLDVSSTTRKSIDDVGNVLEDVLFNLNKYGNVINHWFPEMYETKITKASKTDIGKSKSVIDSIVDKDRFHRMMDIMTLPELNRMGFYPSTFPVFLNKYKFTGKDNKMYSKRVKNLQKELYRLIKEKIENENITGFHEKITARRDVYVNFHKWFYESEYWTDVGYRYIHKKWVDTLKETRLYPGLVQILRIGYSNQTAVNFPPVIAKYIYENSIKNWNNLDEIVILDPCSGWGGRLCGFLGAASDKYYDKKITYLGTDVNSKTHTLNGNYRFGTDPEGDLSKTGMIYEFWNKNVIPIEDRVKVYKSIRPAQELSTVYKDYIGKVDFAMTSPPYFNREVYSNDDSQSYKLGTYDQWREDFLNQLIREVYILLKQDGLFYLNIADIKITKTLIYPLEQDSIDYAEKIGFKYLGKKKMIMSKMIGNDISKQTKREMQNVTNVIGMGMNKYEPIFIFKKI
ncbi:MAG: DNA methyltransferase [Candidatus Pacearchaeota archaeon]